MATVDQIEMMDVCLELKIPGRLPFGTHSVPFAFSLSPTVFNHSAYSDGYRGYGGRSNKHARRSAAKHTSDVWDRGRNYAAVDEWRIDFDGFV